jgi:hypothetical protein
MLLLQNSLKGGDGGGSSEYIRMTNLIAALTDEWKRFELLRTFHSDTMVRRRRECGGEVTSGEPVSVLILWILFFKHFADGQNNGAPPLRFLV